MTTTIPRTVTEAQAAGHPKSNKAPAKKVGATLSKQNAQPGDVGFIGPCVDKIRIVCYLDANLQPTDCHDVPC